MPTNPNVTPAMKPTTDKPQIPNLAEYLAAKLQEILHMEEKDARAYDTAFTWAVVNHLT